VIAHFTELLRLAGRAPDAFFLFSSKLDRISKRQATVEAVDEEVAGDVALPPRWA